MINERSTALPEANKVIGFAEGYVLLTIEDDPSMLYYCTAEAGHITLGENLPYAESRPILLLPEEQQERLRVAVNWKGASG